MNATENWKELGSELSRLLALQSPPIGIAFLDSAPASVPSFEADTPSPTPDGRTGKVAASCVFWIEGTKKTFVTAPEDHGNCSVGQVTHGLKTIDEVADNADVAALIESGWVTMDAVPQIPVVRDRPNFISYGPLEATAVDPDVVFVRLNGKQTMVLHDAWPQLRFEGKPQCHILALAKENGEVAVSVGCMLSRVRTGISNSEMTCAIPAGQLRAVIRSLESTVLADTTVAAYASDDATRFVG